MIRAPYGAGGILDLRINRASILINFGFEPEDRKHRHDDRVDERIGEVRTRAVPIKFFKDQREMSLNQRALVQGGTRVRRYLLPNPKTKRRGSVGAGASVFSAIRKRSGINFSGSGYTVGLWVRLL